MLMTADNGNMEQVRDALAGITGVKIDAPKEPQPEWYMVIVRGNYQLDAVDGLRRRGLRACWPSYEKPVASSRVIGGRQTRRSVRFGILPYVLAQRDTTIDLENVIDNIVSIMDIVRTYSGNTLFLPDSDVDIIRRIAIEQGIFTPEPALHNFKTGQKVKFRDDLSSRWPPGLIVKIAKEGRISVEINMMGRKVPITVLPHQIERI